MDNSIGMNTKREGFVVALALGDKEIEKLEEQINVAKNDENRVEVEKLFDQMRGVKFLMNSIKEELAKIS